VFDGFDDQAVRGTAGLLGERAETGAEFWGKADGCGGGHGRSRFYCRGYKCNTDRWTEKMQMIATMRLARRFLAAPRAAFSSAVRFGIAVLVAQCRNHLMKAISIKTATAIPAIQFSLRTRETRRR
jgi:hypothetical protein